MSSALPGSTDPLAPTWTLARFVFLRLLGVAALAAFWSLWNQGLALIGSHGLTPAAETLRLYAQYLEPWSRWRAPTLLWISASDGFLRLVFGTGCVCSALLLLGVLPRAMCALCFACFLSITTTDRIMGTEELRWFNWPADNLLLEASFLAIFLAPRGLFPGLAHAQPVGRTVRYLLYWLAFRLFFGPGMAKVLSSDPQWLELSALQPFYRMLPSPTPATPLLFEAPQWVHRALTLLTLCFEVLGSLAFAVPGWPRRAAALTGIGMMACIQIAGNFRGLALVAIGVLLLMLDDAWLLRRLPATWFAELRRPPERAPPTPAWLARLGVVGASLIVVGGALTLSYPCRLDLGLVPGVRALAEPASAFGLASGYAMFAGMPNDRPELVVQGSDDGETWLDYETLGGAANERSAPRWLAPYSDYLGFALWASARRPPELAPAWLLALQRHLLEGDPTSRSLFSAAPFAERPPHLVRVQRCDFAFASAEERRDGVWWRREVCDVFLPARGLDAVATDVRR